VKVLYFDCFAGAAGDMILGALLDAGLPFDELKRALGSLAVDGWDVSVDRVVKTGVSATKFRVHEHATPSRCPASRIMIGHHITVMRRIIAEDILRRSIDRVERAGKARRSRCSAAGRRRGRDSRHADRQVHLHEVGALDSIIDIVGAVFALEWFNADRIVVSPINVGGGMVSTAHGVFPVPAPATLALSRRAGVFERHPARLLTRPSADPDGVRASVGPVPPMTIERSGTAPAIGVKERRTCRVLSAKPRTCRTQAPPPKRR
jgi:uncharacterized protein (DUF111 family)